ncbi:MAG: UDP-galactopyranose mutase [Parvibaculaceae bacterium]
MLIAGAGFSGAALARCLADAGLSCLVVDERPHAGGNCHTSEDAETGIMVHRYGPHIFHTDDARIWQFMERFGAWMPYRHAVHATVGGRVYGLPINLLTINQFFGTSLAPSEARAFLAGKCVPCERPSNFEEQALALVGPELYEAFLRSYTEKQWGMEARALPASLLKRLPLRFNYDGNYFHHRRQAMPRDGYTAIVTTMLDHPSIETRLGVRAEEVEGAFQHRFYCGGIDRYFGYRLGPLGYRTLRFEEIRGEGDVLGCPVMNFPDRNVPWTRMTEHRHLSPWRPLRGTSSIVWQEFPETARRESVLYYPLRLAGDERLLRGYVEEAREAQGVTFLGRLGTYSYIDMDAAVGRAMETAEAVLSALREGAPLRPFYHDPLSKA